MPAVLPRCGDAVRATATAQSPAWAIGTRSTSTHRWGCERNLNSQAGPLRACQRRTQPAIGPKDRDTARGTTTAQSPAGAIGTSSAGTHRRGCERKCNSQAGPLRACQRRTQPAIGPKDRDTARGTTTAQSPAGAIGTSSAGTHRRGCERKGNSQAGTLGVPATYTASGCS